MKSLAVFCGSYIGKNPAFLKSARKLGETFVKNNITLVYGGASVGLMGALADSVLQKGGRAVGVIPNHLVCKEVAHKNLTEIHIVNTMHERKALMVELAEGFVAMPGGFGTLDEFCEVFTWSQLGIHQKPCALLNIAGFFDHFISFLDQATEQTFISKAHRMNMIEARDCEELLVSMKNYRPVEVKTY